MMQKLFMQIDKWTKICELGSNLHNFHRNFFPYGKQRKVLFELHS